MNQEEFVYCAQFSHSFEDTVVLVLKAVEKKGWAIFQVYDIQERLSAKGFDVGKVRIIEICSAKYAGKMLSVNKLISLCIPCKINVIEENGKVMILTMKPSVMGSFFEDIEPVDFIDIESDLKEMVELSK